MDIPFLGGRSATRAATSNLKTYTMWTTPWEWKTSDGIYINGDKDAWMYRCLDLFPIEHEDQDARFTAARQLDNLLSDIGRLSPDNKTGVRQLDKRREIHILSVTWYDLLAPPEENTDALKHYQQQAFGFAVPNRLLSLGVKLEDSISDRLKAEKKKREKDGTDSWFKTTWSALNSITNQGTENDVPTLDKFAKDRKAVTAIFNRNRAHIPTISEANQMEAWFNDGRTPDVLIDVKTDYIEIVNGSDTKEIEFSVLQQFETREFMAPYSQWIFDALSTGAAAPCLVSIRGELERPSSTRLRARKATRRRLANWEEEEESGDLEKQDLKDEIAMGEDMDRYLANERNSTLTRCSIIFAREVTPEHETYMDLLQENYGIRVKPLPKRQMPALDEVQPASVVRVNPFVQDVSISMISYAGLQAFSSLGDKQGAYMGLVNPELAPLYVDPRASSRHNLPPVFCVFGEPGSGKTFFAQSFATQCVLSHLPVIFINPKGGSSLIGMVNFVNEFCHGASASRISMSEAEQTPGSFDPFRFTTPQRAADLAIKHIMDAFDMKSQPMDQDERLLIENGIRKGAEAKVKTTWEALDYINNAELRESFKTKVQLMSENSSLFALGVAKEAQDRIDMPSHLTLIDFDREIGLPDPKKSYSEYERSEILAVSAVNLIMSASLEVLLANKGGVIVLDEAWTFLQQPSAMQFLNRLGREGRSLNIIPVFLTQRIKDVISQDMESYISRVLVLQMKDPDESVEAFRICGLQLTTDRERWLREAGPQTGEFAQGLFRDLWGRHSVVDLGPTPPLAEKAWSTNPEELFAREKELQEQAEREVEELRRFEEAAKKSGVSVTDLINEEQLTGRSLDTSLDVEELADDVDVPAYSSPNASVTWEEDENVSVPDLTDELENA